MSKLVKDKKVLLKALLAVILAYAVFKLVSTLVIRKLPIDSIPVLFISEVILVALTVGAALYTRRLSALKPTGKGFFTGILVGWWLVVQPVAAIVFSLFSGGIDVTVSAGYVVLFLLAVLLVGIGEELMFRGILLNGLFDAIGETTPARIRGAVVISGCIFGAFHLFNIFSGAAIMGTLLQAVSAAAAGILLGAVYIRSGKNLWPGILLHAFLDCCSFAVSGVLAGADYIVGIGSYSLVMLVPAAIEILTAFIAMRDKKLLPLIKAEE